LHKREENGFSIEEGGPSNTPLELCKWLKKRKFWVAMSVGTLVTNEGRMLGCIQEKLLVSYVPIWDRDQPVAGNIVPL
jgi:hypothetical protein